MAGSDLPALQGAAVSPISIPRKARRTAGVEECVDSLSKAFESSTADDAIELTKILRGNPMVASFLMRLWRRGTIQNAMHRLSVSKDSLKNDLGKKLGAKMTKFGNLSGGFHWTLFFSLLGQARGKDVIELEEWVIDDQDAQAWNLFALQASKTIPLPKGHAHDAYEGTLLLVLLHRAQQCDNLLKGLTPSTRSSYGYFFQDEEQPLQVGCILRAHKVRMPIAQETVDARSDWRVMDNRLPTARFGSKTAELWVGFAGHFKKQHSFEMPSITEAFSYPDAADALKSLAEPDMEKNKKGPGVETPKKHKRTEKGEPVHRRPPRSQKRKLSPVKLAAPLIACVFRWRASALRLARPWLSAEADEFCWGPLRLGKLVQAVFGVRTARGEAACQAELMNHSRETLLASNVCAKNLVHFLRACFSIAYDSTSSRVSTNTQQVLVPVSFLATKMGP